MLPLYNNQISLLTILFVIHRSSLKWSPVYSVHRNFIPQVVVIHRFDCMYCIRHIQNYGLFSTVFFSGFLVFFSGVFSSIIKTCYMFTSIATLTTHIQAYSAPCVTLTYLQPCHVQNPGIFRTGGLIKTLWNIDQAYFEPCHRALFSHNQTY